MTLNRRTRAKLVNVFRHQFRDDEVTKYVYSFDFGAISKIPFINKKTLPDGVILIKTVDDLKKVFEIANKEKVKLTPRMNNTTSDGGSLTYNGGIILDLRGLSGEIFLEPGDPSISVPASMTFAEIRKYLKWHGFDLCSYPFNIHSATVGGWIATGGYGIGSTSYGGIGEQVLELEVVKANGEVETIIDPTKIDLYIGSHGKLGIITRAKLKIRFDSKLSYRLCMFDNVKQLVNALKIFRGMQPFTIIFFNPQMIREINKVFHYNLPARYALLVVKETHFDEVERDFYKQFNSFAREAGGELLDYRYYEGIFDIQNELVKVLTGSTVYSMTTLKIDPEQSESLIKYLESKFKKNLFYYGTILPTNGIALYAYLSFRQELSEFQKLKVIIKFYKKILKIHKLTQGAYSTGLWYVGYDKRDFNKEAKKAFLKLKSENDPNNILNPQAGIRSGFKTPKRINILTKLFLF